MAITAGSPPMTASSGQQSATSLRPSDCNPSNQLRQALRNGECPFAAPVLLRGAGSWASLLPLRRPGYPEDLRTAALDRGVEPLGDRQERRRSESLLRLCSSGDPLAGPDEARSPELRGNRNGHCGSDSAQPALRSRPAQGAVGL